MKLGIISDTHNNIDVVRRALDLLRDNGISHVIHAGDITSPKMLGLFKDFKARFVLGNGDIDSEALNEESLKLGFGPIEESCVFVEDGKNIIVFHGNNVPLFREAVASGKYHYVIKGHTHLFENYMAGTSRVINPGALYGADEFTVAILDTETGRVERILVETE